MVEKTPNVDLECNLRDTVGLIKYGLRFIEKKGKENFFSDRIERMTTARLNYCFSSRSLHVLRM